MCFNFLEYTGWVIQYVLDESGHHRFLYMTPVCEGLGSLALSEVCHLGWFWGFRKPMPFPLSCLLSCVCGSDTHLPAAMLSAMLVDLEPQIKHSFICCLVTTLEK